MAGDRSQRGAKWEGDGFNLGATVSQRVTSPEFRARAADD